MPGAGDELLRVLEERVLEAGPISSLVKWDLVRLVETIMGDIPFDILDKRGVFAAAAARTRCHQL